MPSPRPAAKCNQNSSIIRRQQEEEPAGTYCKVSPSRLRETTSPHTASRYVSMASVPVSLVACLLNNHVSSSENKSAPTVNFNHTGAREGEKKPSRHPA